MKKIRTILLIIQRSNGDVFMSLGLIRRLQDSYVGCEIDLLINDDTFPVASLFPNIRNIYKFSYHKKKTNRWTQEKSIILSIFRKYDLSINLTASDRSVIYSILASEFSISAIEQNSKKSWWKKLGLRKYYYFDNSIHILQNNYTPLDILEISHKKNAAIIEPSNEVFLRVKNELKNKGIDKFIVFHPSAQYDYKIYPKKLRNELIKLLRSLKIKIVVTGSTNEIDTRIKNEIKFGDNIVDFIGRTSLEEFISLSQLSIAYLGMDTLNMHIAASQKKRIFAIFGPTILSMWAPWTNELDLSQLRSKAVQNYSNVTIFQADMPCVACGKAGCLNIHGKSECLYNISPNTIFNEIKEWVQNDGV